MIDDTMFFISWAILVVVSFCCFAGWVLEKLKDDIDIPDVTEKDRPE